MNTAIPQAMLDMLIPVAKALGDDLLPHVAFVGGSTTAFLISDTVTCQKIRYTEDVDLIVHVDNYANWLDMKGKLRARGFKEKMEGEGSICRLYLGDIKVDFMPDNAEGILGFTNRWYHAALLNTRPYPLTEQITINLLAPEYFIATKLEAYHGRGNNDPMSSHDLEDIINLVDGREELLEELQKAEPSVKRYIAEQFTLLLQHSDFEYTIQGNLSDSGRCEDFFNRWEAITALN